VLDNPVSRFADELVEEFGRERLEETAFPVYANRLYAARYLGWSRIRAAQRRIEAVPARERALDFGAGLGVMLPFLSARFERVVACDTDPAITEFMVERLGLDNVEVVPTVTSTTGDFDTITALDVLEHIKEIDTIYRSLLAVTRPDGQWVISGPTENQLYRAMRIIARTTGEGHVHTVHDVLGAVPTAMRHVWHARLPFGLPLFVVADYRRR
jgi:2-polyprenyl-3-methyl-5-hydroxy-6-metoxy-1,4-benzoquinol methylase